MGITKGGRFAALTNYRDPASRKQDAPSRGHLVRDYLEASNPPGVFLRRLHPKADQFNGFNLLVGSPDKLMYYSNHKDEATLLEPGLYGLSNDLLETTWPKTRKAKEELSSIVKQDTIDETALFEVLKNDQVAPDDQLPDTGIPRELERAVSPIFIKTEKYGTRCSTILLISKDGEVTFEERCYKNGSTEVENTSRFNFELEGR